MRPASVRPLSLVLLFALAPAACTLIAEVDRGKIAGDETPTNTGGQQMGGMGGSGADGSGGDSMGGMGSGGETSSGGAMGGDSMGGDSGSD
jgi:hypothetical protein